MQRILNNPDVIVDEMLQGFLKSHRTFVEATENPRVVKSKYAEKGRVTVITGGGSGHKPAFVGYCGKNMCDAVAVGEICSSPTAKAFLDAAGNKLAEELVRTWLSVEFEEGCLSQEKVDQYVAYDMKRG